MILAALALAASGPSFDCAKATTDVEKMICADPELAAADRAVAKLYAAVPRRDRKNLYGKQSDWLADRNRCQDKPCLVAAYEERLTEVLVRATGIKSRDYAMKGNPSGSLSIVDVGDGWSAFSAQAIWIGSAPGAVHDSETAGVFKLRNGRASRAPSEEYDCGWKIRRLPGNRWKLEDWPGREDGGPCGAVNASVAGVYTP